MTAPFLPYAKQSIIKEDLHAVSEALQGDWITRGPVVQHFEHAVANYCQAPFAVAFNSGTAALMAAYFAARLTPADRVITTPNSFIATIGAPVEMGIRPCFVDIDRSTGSLNPMQLKQYLDFQSTRGRPFIVPVHFAGPAIDMAAVERQIKHPDAVVIEDAAHALGSCYPTGERVGSCAYSQMTIFSFHPAKLMTTGEGGMVTTRDPELYHRLLLYRDNGIERTAPYLKKGAAFGYYEVDAITGNFNVTSFQAALGLSQLKRLDLFIAQRRELVKRYRSQLKDVPHLLLFTDRQDDYSAFHLFVVQIDYAEYGLTRSQVIEHLKERGIGSQVHYIPLYRHPVLRLNAEDEVLQYSETEAYYSQALSLPLYYDLTEGEVDRVCAELKAILRRS